MKQISSVLLQGLASRRKSFCVLVFLSVLVAAAGISPRLHASGRGLPKENEVQILTVEFNGDSIKAYYLLIDTRSPEEVEEAKKTGSLPGSVLLFFQGHAQRSDNAYELTSLMSMKSKSGIVIVPVCDTPYGRDPKWRTDRGKDVVFMEMTRHVLRSKNIAVKGYRPLTSMGVTIDGKKVPGPEKDKGLVTTELTVVGWSHGGILARRLAHAYPGSVKNLAQMCSAGFERWGGKNCIGSTCLLTNFTAESTCISLGIFTGEAGAILGTGWGITRGMAGDSLRAYGSCISGNTHPGKLLRPYFDLRETPAYVDGSVLPVPEIKNIVVMFGEDDSVFEWENVGFTDKNLKKRKEVEAFWANYYPAAVTGGAGLMVKVLPGKHHAPAVHYKEYGITTLKGTKELKE